MFSAFSLLVWKQEENFCRKTETFRGQQTCCS